MPRAWARAWAASCSRVPRTSSGVRRSPSPLIMTSAYCWPATFHRPGAWWPQRGCLPSVPLAMMMTTGGDVRVPAADFQPGLFQDLQDRAGGLGERLPFADPFPVRVRCRTWCTGRPFAVAEGGAPGAVEPVVPASPVRVGQGVVGFGDLPELLSGVGAVVHVRVVLLGQLAVGRLDQRRSHPGGHRAARSSPVSVGFS